MKLETFDLYVLLQSCRRSTPIGTVLSHKKGGTYIVTGHSFNTETAVVDVHYKRVDGPNFNKIIEEAILFNRPNQMFTEDRFLAYG